jgi:hypothetical protein
MWFCMYVSEELGPPPERGSAVQEWPTCGNIVNLILAAAFEEEEEEEREQFSGFLRFLTLSFVWRWVTTSPP